MAASLWAISALSPASVEAAIVDAGAVTSVVVEAPLYDPNLSDAGGCDPSGCVGELSRVRGSSGVSRERNSCLCMFLPCGCTR